MERNYQTPNFFILGAAKSGTTSLYEILKHHPQIHMSFVKEPMFFSRDDYYANGIEWYGRTFFPEAPKTRWRGEASPHYLYWADKVAPRIRASLESKDLRFVVALRDPVTRAYSWYWNMIKEGEEKLSFEEALALEEERLQQHEDLQIRGSMIYGYQKGSLYANQIREYLRHFPKAQFFFILQEDLQNPQSPALQSLYSFLNIEPQTSTLVKSNPSVQPRLPKLQSWLRNNSPIKEVFKRVIPFGLRHSVKTYLMEKNSRAFSYPPMLAETQAMLRSRFAEEVSELQSLIDRDLSHWLPS